MRFRSQRQIVLLVERKHFDVAQEYMSNTDCPIATAIKDYFKGKVHVQVTAEDVSINGVKYDILGSSGRCATVTFFWESGYLQLPVVLRRQS